MRHKKSEVAEEGGADKQADAYPGMVLLIVKQALAIAVVVLQHDELVGVMVDAITQLDDGVKIEVPPLALDQRHVEHPLVVGAFGLKTCLIQSAILEDVTVVFTVNNGNPVFGMGQQERYSSRRPTRSCSSCVMRCHRVRWTHVLPSP